MKTFELILQMFRSQVAIKNVMKKASVRTLSQEPVKISKCSDVKPLCLWWERLDLRNHRPELFNTLAFKWWHIRTTEDPQSSSVDISSRMERFVRDGDDVMFGLTELELNRNKIKGTGIRTRTEPEIVFGPASWSQIFCSFFFMNHVTYGCGTAFSVTSLLRKWVFFEEKLPLVGYELKLRIAFNTIKHVPLLQ